MNSDRPVTVAGASSQLGVFLLPRLLADGYTVRAVSRRAPAEPLPRVDGLAWFSPSAICGENPASLVSCGPIDLACELVEAGKVAGKAVVFSTSSVRTKAASEDREERQEIGSIAEGEGRLKALCAERGIALLLIRPTLVYGCGMDRNLSLLLRLGERSGFIPVSRQANGKRQPVHADDLAALAQQGLQTEFGQLLEGEACGGSTLTYRAMVERIAACGSRRIIVVGIPGPVFTGLVRTASSLGPWKGINTEMVRRQATDMVFDDTLLRSTLSWTPRPFEPGPKDFQIPPNLQQYRLPL